MTKLFGWKWMLAAAVIGALVSGTGIGFIGKKLHDAEITRLEKQHEDNLIAQKESLQLECQAAMDITSEVSNDYQTQIANLRAQLNKLKRVQPKCIPILRDPGSAGRRAGPSTAR